MHRFGAAAQNAGIARFEAEAGRVRGHVGTRLIDDADDPEGDAHAADLDAGGAILEVADLADWIGERGNLSQAIGHRRDRGGLQGQAVDERGVVAGRARSADVPPVGGEKLRLVAADRRRDRIERGVLGVRRRAGQSPRRRACALANFPHVCGKIEAGDAQVAHAPL